MTAETSVEADEVAKFEAMAAEWWDPAGRAAPLHRMNPCRLDYVADQIAAEFDRDRRAPSPFAGLRLLDIGCGGGLMAEPMARLGADVLGADAAEANVRAARAHAEASGLAIDYRATTAEALAAGGETFDVVLAMEIVEHVADPRAFLATCGALLRPGGLVICSTLNRTAKAFALAVVGAERVLRWLPVGTHDWRKFLTPGELADMLAAGGLEVVDRKGMVFDPLSGAWRLSPRDLSVNHVAAAVKPAALG
jgi:2-polyprenyl-6-hydroxyphenyl methylase/3-demethylubiquinone-9 3-methyltransferase